MKNKKMYLLSSFVNSLRFTMAYTKPIPMAIPIPKLLKDFAQGRVIKTTMAPKRNTSLDIFENKVNSLEVDKNRLFSIFFIGF